MVEVSKIENREGLKAWLDVLPEDRADGSVGRQQAAACIAMRAAARIVPIWWKAMLSGEWVRKRHVTALPVLRGVAICGAAAARPAPQITAAAAAEAAEAAEAAANAAHAAEAASAAEAARVVHAAAVAARVAAEAHDDTWQSVRRDCEAIADRASPHEMPLWVELPPTAARDWTAIKRTLAERGEAEAWAYWTHWYDRLLDPQGQPPNVGLWTEIATSPEIDWDAGPDTALPVINEIWAKHRTRAESLVENALDRAVSQQPRPERDTIRRARASIGENRRELPPTLDAVQGLLCIEIDRWQTSNELNAQHPDLTRQQLATYLVMYEALERLRPLIPAEGEPTEADAAEAVSLGRSYWDKLSSLPRDKADEVVAKVWSTGGNVVDLGLVLGSAKLVMMLGLPPQASMALGALAFGRDKAAQIVAVAKDHLKAK